MKTKDALLKRVTKKISEIIDKHVPSTIPTMKRPVPWWNKMCQKAWEKKQHAFEKAEKKEYYIRSKKANKVFKKAFYKLKSLVADD